ncbi:MAG: filamentous hemagglutinin N-terminal domain-containing protein [Cyanobacteria bacterium J06626_23]
MNCLFRCASSLQTIVSAGTSVGGCLGAALWIAPAQAQPVPTTLAPGVTDTVITSPENNPDQYNITGGVLSEGSAPNLFHHFQQFDVGTNDTATFVVPGQVENVINLIENVNPARVNGTLGLTGADANLYLVSPGGVIFGPGAQLALPADLTVTTADALLFDETQLAVVQSGEGFNAAGLTGAPSGHVFTVLEPNGIENQGALGLAANQSLTLLGGTVQNSGTITVPGGTVNLAAVPGGYTVRISRPGNLLSLEITPNATDLEPFEPTPIGPETFDPTDLPGMLTGGESDSGSELVKNPDGSFSVITAVQPETEGNGPNLSEVGTVVVQGAIDVSGTTGGDITLIGPRVALIGATLTAEGTAAGGTIQVGSLPIEVMPDVSTPANLETVFVYADRLTDISTSGITPQSSGGLVYIWSSDTTQYYGQVTAAGEGGTVLIDGVERQPVTPRPARPGR